MAIVSIRIGSSDNVVQYDDVVHASAIETAAPMRAGVPVVGNDVVRLDDIASGATAAAVIADHAIVRGDGGDRGIQDSTVIIDDAGSVTIPSDVEITDGDLDLLEGSLFLNSIYSKQPRLHMENHHDDVFAPQLNFYKFPETLSDDDQLAFIGGFCIRDAQPQAYIDFRVADESNGHTGGEINFGVKVDDTTRYMLRLRGYNGSVGEAEVIINDDGVDCDFRVESAVSVNGLFLRGDDGFVGIGGAPTSQLDVHGAISSDTITVTTGTYDTLDVSEVNTIFVDTSGGPVVFRGTTGGVDGQVLMIVVHDFTGNTTINDIDGAGTQKFYLHAEGNETLTGEPGGWVFVNHGGDHWMDASHARHP
jgi:hypothetical protein